MLLTTWSKGAVETLVKFVTGNFLAGRSFYDDADLEQDCAAWVERVNTQRESDATEQLPIALRAEERPRFTPLPAVAADCCTASSTASWSAARAWSPLRPTATPCRRA